MYCFHTEEEEREEKSEDKGEGRKKEWKIMIHEDAKMEIEVWFRSCLETPVLLRTVETIKIYNVCEVNSIYGRKEYEFRKRKVCE